MLEYKVLTERDKLKADTAAATKQIADLTATNAGKVDPTAIAQQMADVSAERDKLKSDVAAAAKQVADLTAANTDLAGKLAGLTKQMTEQSGSLAILKAQLVAAGQTPKVN